MKLKSILIAALALTGFVGNAWADTDKLTAEDGWVKITSVPTASDIANNYYVFVDATSDLMLGIGKGVHQDTKWYSLGVFYRNSVEPTAKDFIPLTWMLESFGSGFALRNLDQPVSPFQTEWNAAWKFDTNDVYATANEWTEVRFTLSDGVWTLQNGKYPDSGYIGPWNDGNFTNGAECAANKSGANVGKFYIYAISRAQFKQNLLDNASSSNPVDLTPWYVSNATFDGNSSDAWTTSYSANSSGWWGSHAFSNLGSENYQQVAEVKQTLTLPNGRYKVALQGASNKVSENLAYVFGTHNGNTEMAYFTQSTVSTTDGEKWNDMQYNLLLMMQDRSYGQVLTPEITVTTGTLTVGYKNENGHSWDVFDNFKLYCTGVDLSAYQTQLADLVTECNGFITSAVVPDACENIISSAVSTYNQEYATAKEYSSAIVALTNVLDTYRNDTELQTAYAAYYAFKEKVEGLKTGVDDGETKTTFNNAISTATANVEAATTSAAINTQKASLHAAAMTFISTTTGSFDITFLASQNYADWKKKDGSAAGIVADEFLTNRPSDIPSFAESYETTCATTGTVLYQTIENLPAGYYQVGMYAAAMFTSGRGFDSEATEGDANRTFAFAGDLNDAGSILRTGAPISFNTVRDFNDLTTLDVNVHLSTSGNLTFGVQKDANGSNWHFAQIMSIVYSNQPDLTNLQATRDALVSEAEGLLNGSADYLTSDQQTALQSAITAGNDADDFETLNTVTLTTLPDAINTAKQQVQLVKENRVLMLAALERFENDYNLTDGTDYSRVTMSAKAWTDLLATVNAVSTALDDVSLATSYGSLKDALVAQMDATDASIRLFKSYKAMVEGTTALSIAEGTTYGADSYMDTDANEQTAIETLNTVFGSYAAMQSSDIDMSGFLGANLDFSAAEGNALNTENSNNIHEVTGWEVAYAEADTWAVIQTHQNDNQEKLYIRKNWGSAAATLKAFKEKMLPVGKYRLSFSWNSDLANMTNLSQCKIGEKLVSLGENRNATLTYDFEVTDNAQPFDLTFGFQKTGTGNTPAQIVIDDVALICLGVNSLLMADYDPAALWFDATDEKYAAAKNVAVAPTAANQIIKAAAADQFSGLTKNVILNGTCANLVITDGSPLDVQEAFTATNATYSRTMSNAWGTVILPFALTSNADVQLYRLKASDDANMTFKLIDGAAANSPVTFQKLTDASSVTFSVTNAAVSTTSDTQNELTTAAGWTSEGSYTAQSITDFKGIYYIASNKFWAADGTIALNPFRAIYRYGGDTPVKQFSISIDEQTAISHLENGNAEAPLYDLSGQRIQSAKPKAGIYIRNGKKIIFQ